MLKQVTTCSRFRILCCHGIRDDKSPSSAGHLCMGNLQGSRFTSNTLSVNFAKTTEKPPAGICPCSRRPTVSRKFSVEPFASNVNFVEVFATLFKRSYFSALEVLLKANVRILPCRDVYISVFCGRIVAAE
ncbi:hypothetical protein M758_UG129000 [Ceratodon purpureus]|nr:hypothetical protein M758_UG129000 [Ceratodon purpureus]